MCRLRIKDVPQEPGVYVPYFADDICTHTHGICNGASHDCSHSVSCGTLRDNEEVAQGIYFLREHRLVGGLMYHLIGQNS
jgi:hypothetical protein